MKQINLAIVLLFLHSNPKQFFIQSTSINHFTSKLARINIQFKFLTLNSIWLFPISLGAINFT
jgi:hypothetical protein